MWITRLKLVKLDTESPTAIARVQTARGGKRRSAGIPIVRDPDTGYRWIDTDELQRRLVGHITGQNSVSEPEGIGGK